MTNRDIPIEPEGAIQIDVKTDDAVPTITQQEFKSRAEDILRKARHGAQVAIVDDSGKILEIIGMNGIRTLPEPVIEDEDLDSSSDDGAW